MTNLKSCRGKGVIYTKSRKKLRKRPDKKIVDKMRKAVNKNWNSVKKIKLPKCSYENCKKVATITLGLNDPDATRVPYCNKHAEQRKTEILMEIFKRK